MRFKNMQELKEIIKDLDEKQKKDFMNNLSDEEEQVFKDEIIVQHKVRFTFIDDDFADYTDDDDELDKRVIDIEDAINSYDQESLWYTKESLNNPYIIRILAHCIKDTYKDLDPERLNDLIGKYNKINEFIKNDDNYDEIIGYYGDIVNKDANGFYKVNDAIAKKLLKDNDLSVKNDELDDIKEAISLTWENKKEILNPSEINDLSEKQNGLNFKEFIFCEEYLKRGKIKPTCEHLGISRNTAYLWLKDEKVQDYLKNRQDEIKKETDKYYKDIYRYRSIL